MKLTFQLADEVVIVKAIGHQLLFTNSTTNFQQYAPIEGLQLKKEGILKEFPDLEGLEPNEMRIEATKRFNNKVKTLETQNKIKEYLVNEFTKMGYTLKMVQKEGFRPTKT